MIPQQKIDEVLAATDIVSVIGRKVNLKKTIYPNSNYPNVWIKGGYSIFRRDE